MLWPRLSRALKRRLSPVHRQGCLSGIHPDLFPESSILGALTARRVALLVVVHHINRRTLLSGGIFFCRCGRAGQQGLGHAARTKVRKARLSGGILKGAPRTRASPLFQEGSRGATQASRVTLVLVSPLFSSQGSTGRASVRPPVAKTAPPLFDPRKMGRAALNKNPEPQIN